MVERRLLSIPLAFLLALASGVGASSCGGEDEGSSAEIESEDAAEGASLAPVTSVLAKAAITTLPGASPNAGALGELVRARLTPGSDPAPALSNSLVSAVPGAPAKPVFVGQTEPFDAVLIAIRGRSGYLSIPAGNNARVALDLVPVLNGILGEFTVLVATQKAGRISATRTLRLFVDRRIFLAAGDLENHDADGSNIADLFAPFLEGNQGFPPVPEQVLDATDNNDEEINGLKGLPGPAASGHREVVWDGVPADLRNRPDFSAQFFNRANTARVGVRGGIVFNATNGTGQEVNDALDGRAQGLPPASEDEEAPLGGDFSNINPKFTGNLLSFTQSAQFATLGTVITDITCKLAGTDQRGVVSGLGIVFSSVDRGRGTSVEYFNDRGVLIAKVFAPAQSSGPFPFAGPVAADKFPYSFVGFVDRSARIARVRVTCGEIPIDRANDDLPLGDLDVVAFDDVYYGEPRP